MPSRQYAHYRKQTIDRLKIAAANLPLIIGDAGDAFTVHHWTGGVNPEPAIAGRYQTVRAWIDGFAAGYHARTQKPLDAIGKPLSSHTGKVT